MIPRENTLENTKETQRIFPLTHECSANRES